MSFTSLLIETCTVRRYTTGAADSYGKPVETWADHLTDQACRLMSGSRGIGSAASAGREFQVGAELVVADYIMFIEDVDITEQDRVVSGGVTYEILMVADRADGTASHHREVWLKAVR